MRSEGGDEFVELTERNRPPNGSSLWWPFWPSAATTGRVGVAVGEAVAVFRAEAQHRGFDPSTFAERREARLFEYERRWGNELGEHLEAAVPEFDGTKRADEPPSSVSRLVVTRGLQQPVPAAQARIVDDDPEPAP